MIMYYYIRISKITNMKSFGEGRIILLVTRISKNGHADKNTQ
jgi:hypothetical protein